MKKMLSLLLVVVLILSVLVLPALAAGGARRSHICPACGGTCYSDMEASGILLREKQTCPSSSTSHYHENTYLLYYAVCEDCGYRLLTSRVLRSSKCLLNVS